MRPSATLSMDRQTPLTHAITFLSISALDGEDRRATETRPPMRPPSKTAEAQRRYQHQNALANGPDAD